MEMKFKTVCGECQGSSWAPGGDVPCDSCNGYGTVVLRLTEAMALKGIDEFSWDDVERPHPWDFMEWIRATLEVSE